MEDSPLLKLPPELRNRIYEMVLKCPTAISIVVKNQAQKHEHLTTSNEIKRQRLYALLRTCQCINAECRQLLYAANSYHIVAENADMISKIPIKFFKKIGSRNFAALRDVQVTYSKNKTSTELSGLCFEILRSMVTVRRMLSRSPKCNCIVKFRSVAAGEAFALQGLPLLLRCDLQDLEDPWDAQIYALKDQGHIWEQIEHNRSYWLSSECEGLFKLLSEWRDGLKNV